MKKKRLKCKLLPCTLTCLEFYPWTKFFFISVPCTNFLFLNQGNFKKIHLHFCTTQTVLSLSPTKKKTHFSLTHSRSVTFTFFYFFLPLWPPLALQIMAFLLLVGFAAWLLSLASKPIRKKLGRKKSHAFS